MKEEEMKKQEAEMSESELQEVSGGAAQRSISRDDDGFLLRPAMGVVEDGAAVIKKAGIVK